MSESVTIGVLDGVHRGHQTLLDRLDKSLTRTVLTFEPHPVEVLKPGTNPRLITNLKERTEILLSLGIDQVEVLDLAEIKELSAEDFISEYLIGRHDTAHIVVGSDFRFGKDRSGDVDLLTREGLAAGFRVDAIELVSDSRGVVSSSRIRSLLEDGDVLSAAAMLTRPYSLTETVIHGDKRGREIGYPTANLRPPARKVIPGTGVYAGFCKVGGVTHQTAINVGYRPTFGGDVLLIEAYILDFDDDIYGRELRVDFIERLRPELKFDNVQELIERMGDDVARSRQILELASAPNVS